MTILVTGGAGYIGSHVVRLLEKRGEKVVVLDDISEGFTSRIGDTPLVKIDLSSETAIAVLEETIKKNDIDGVVHLAARKKVGESVEKPDWYHQQNVIGMQNLLEAMRRTGVKKLVFSSSAATYGTPDVERVTEDLECKPINPYGKTKLEGEHLAADAAKTWGLKEVCLRYFNVAGTGWPELNDVQVANLVPIIFKNMNEGTEPTVFGVDWPTPDGTCVRDYVHVLDLAEAHLAALDYLDQPDQEFDIFNVGTGTGSSVFDVIHAIEKVSGKKINPILAPRRPGDPAYLCADVSRIEKTLGWKAKHNLLEIVDSVWKAQPKA